MSSIPLILKTSQSGVFPCVLGSSALRQQDPLFVRFSYLQDRFKCCPQSFKSMVCRSTSPLILPSLCPQEFLNCLTSSSTGNLLISSACPLTFSIYKFITSLSLLDIPDSVSYTPPASGFIPLVLLFSIWITTGPHELKQRRHL
jgi:hypothetical protein